MELMIAAGKAVPGLQLEHGLAVERVYTGSFMTSLDMAGTFMLTRMYAYIQKHQFIVLLLLLFSIAGFSISVMKADQSILNRLDAPTRAPNWPVAADG